MNELETKLFEAMLAAGASPSCAQVHASNFAAIIGPKIKRERRNRAICELFPIIGAHGVIDKFGVSRRTAYYIIGKKCKRVTDDCTKAA